LSAVLDKVLKGETAGQAWLGLRPAVLEFDDAARLGYPSVAGVLVAGLPQGSPAAVAGVVADDIITGIDGTALDSPFTLRALLYVRSPGDRVTLEVFRGGVTRKVKVELKAVDANDPPRLYSEEFGASVEKPDEATLFRFGLRSGAEVDYFDHRGTAWKLGLRSGDIVTKVNGEGFSTLVEFRELFLRARTTGTVSVIYIESISGVERESRIEITK
jgi:serine protease Do